MSDHDAILVTSFGGPEGPEDVMPFLRRVVMGRNVDDDRLAEVATHYLDRGGVSPINAQNRALVAALESELRTRDIDLPVLWGNRNWHPLLEDTVAAAAGDGHRRLLALVTSAYSSYSGCRQYREDLARARTAAIEATGHAPDIDKVRVYFNHPGFVNAMVDRVVTAMGDLATPATSDLVFVTHSIPATMSRHSDYVAQHLEACRLVARGVRHHRDDWTGQWQLAYCSRSGPPWLPWLEPDVNDHLESVATTATTGVVVVPIGFVSDHMEVIHDLDVEAARTAAGAGLDWARAGTVGTHPAFVAGLADLVAERVDAAPRAAMGTMGPSHDACPLDCCRVPGRPVAPTIADQAVTPHQ